ncbi:MAG TPA: HAD-IA family hydrolase [Candidatus Saccharimonadia bacterium]|nr:HAD-IA family hydrolase [Candidatus Saccharimonadia bacterium]
MLPVRAVGFDYTGVVATLPSGDFFDEMARVAGTSRAVVKEAYTRYRRDFQLGNLTERQLWSRVASNLSATDRFDQLWRRAISRLPSPDPEILALVDTLRSGGIKVGMLSNLAVPTPWSTDLYASGTAAHFDAVVLSGDIGYVKPEPEAFKVLAGALGVSPAELIFVDDRAEALAGIDRLEIRPVQYTGMTALKKSLQHFGLSLQASA